MQEFTKLNCTWPETDPAIYIIKYRIRGVTSSNRPHEGHLQVLQVLQVLFKPRTDLQSLGARACRCVGVTLDLTFDSRLNEIQLVKITSDTSTHVWMRWKLMYAWIKITWDTSTNGWMRWKLMYVWIKITWDTLTDGWMRWSVRVQFSSRWYLCARKSPYALHPSLRSFPNVAFELTVPIFVFNWQWPSLSSFQCTAHISRTFLRRKGNREQFRRSPCDNQRGPYLSEIHAGTLTLSPPWCHFRATNKSAKFESLNCFCLLFRTGTWKDFLRNTKHWK